ncbi:MAG: DUF2974 domain-containing protein [Clostridia bacterium]|nr:DUF2974 domain-containing protein [Clostridia bacterium]
MASKSFKNIISYVKEEMRTFKEKPFNDVDSLVLSQLSYTHFNGIVDEGGEWIKLHQALKAECFEGMFKNVLSGDKTKKLLFAMCASPRFREVELGFYREITNHNTEQQFASISFKLPFNAIYIAFRGTDSTVVGWKEDFNMAFMRVVPSQEKAVAQVNTVAGGSKLPIIIGGHSKGGNLALYGAAYCNKDAQERITAVYNHDGPGFRKEILQGEGFKRILPLIKKTVPEFSLIGMLLYHKAEYRAVQSGEKLIMQHDPFSWIVKGGDFAHAEDISDNAILIDEAISQWLDEVDDESREKFVDVLFDVISASGLNSFNEFEEDKFNNAKAMLDAIKGIDGETKKFVFKISSLLASLSVKNAAKSTRQKLLAENKDKIGDRNGYFS